MKHKRKVIFCQKDYNFKSFELLLVKRNTWRVYIYIYVCENNKYVYFTGGVRMKKKGLQMIHYNDVSRYLLEDFS